MIDLSHLTEEEQGAIMTVLRRDADLKKAEEDRISKLEKTYNTRPNPDSQWKYISGEWFHEAKSRRHMDKIHGSEIILASMKAKKDPLDGSPLTKRSVTPNSLEVVAPPKPARSLENLPLATINESEERESSISSQKMPRQNPFNRASLIIYEVPNYDNCQEPESSKTEVAALLNSHPGDDSSQVSDTSDTSDASSSGFRPVPIKRTFLSRRLSNGDPGSDAPAGSDAPVVPAPRRRRVQVAQELSPPPGVQNQQQHREDEDQPVYSESKHGGTPSLKGSSSHAEAAAKGRREEPEDKSLGERAALRSDALQSSSVRDSDRGGDSVGRAARPDELSLPQSSADPEPPVSYDLNFIDKSDEKMKKSNQKNVFTLTTQSTSPAGDEESIAKVLDWFHRSTDRSDWLNKAGGVDLRRGSGQNMVVSKSRSEDSLLSDGQGTSKLLQKKIDDANALRAAQRSASTELLEIEEPQQQQVYVPHLRSVWERHKIGPKVLIIKSMMSKNRGHTSGHPSADTLEGNKTNMTSEPEGYSWEGPYGGAKYTSGRRHSLNPSAQDYHNHSDLASAQTANRRASDAGRQRQETRIQPRLSVQTESMSKSNPRLNRSYQSTELLLQDEPSRAPKLDTDFRTRYSPGSFSSPYKDVSWTSQAQRVQPSASPAGNSNVTNAVRGYNPHRNVQELPHQDSSTEKIKQLKSFWEQERKPSFYDGDVIRGPSQSKVSKRFTKSQYDLSSLGNNDHSEANHPNAASAMLGSPDQSASRTQFNNLRQFWDEAASGRPKNTVRTQLTGQDSKFKEPEIHPKTRPVATKSPPSLWKMSTIDCPRDVSQQATSGKDNRPYRARKDSFTSRSREDSIRRAASMFALSSRDENDEVEMDPDPSHNPSRKQRQKSIASRRPSQDTEAPTTRARAHAPRDYRHYLGMTDGASFHGSHAQSPEDEEGRGNYRLDLGEPVQVSTPMRSEAWHSHKSTQMSQYPLGANYSSDAGPDSSLSSTSDSWSNSKKNSDRGSGQDSANPVKKALLRAETRSKSLEDLLASPGQERRHGMAADIRGASDVSSVPSPTPSSLFSDPDHLKKMSKSIPLFLQKEDDAFTDSTSDHSYRSGQLTKGGSLTNLTTSSGLSSLSGSMMTMYSGDLEVQGNIIFSISYIQKLKEFHIFVAQCQDLATADLKKGRSDPYVKSYLVPDKSNLGKRKTSVKKKTLNPTFNEILRYRVDMEYLRTQDLILSVWHHDTFGRNSFLGEVDVDLSKWDFDHTRMNYFPLKSRTVPNLAATSDRGQIKLALRYLPQISHSEGVSHFFNGEIHIWVKECRGLPLIRATINPYVKSFVLPDTSRKSRQKTRVVRRTVDPVFNHTMVYDGIRDIDLSEACVELTVWDRDKLATSLLGGLRLGMGTGSSYGALVEWMDSTPAEVALWEHMKSTPNEWVEDVLPLRMLNPAKATFK